MSIPVISVENLSKRYLVGHRAERTMEERFPNFRDMLERHLRNGLINCGTTEVLVSLSTRCLALGEYVVSIDLTNPLVEFYDRVEDCIRFQVNTTKDTAFRWNLEQRWGYGSTLVPLSLIHRHQLPGGAVEHEQSALQTMNSSPPKVIQGNAVGWPLSRRQ